MLKSDYIRRENERSLLRAGYVCLHEVSGVQVWADVLHGGFDIQHITHSYPLFVDELGCLSPKDADDMGAVYFVVKNSETTFTHQGTRLAQAVSESRRR